MIREMVGWVRYDTETWDCTMHRMKHRVNQALQQHKILSWSERIQNMKVLMIQRVANLPNDQWEVLTSEWVPNGPIDESQEYFAYRSAGRPILRWNDII